MMNLIDIGQQWARECPNKIAYTFLNNDLEEKSTLNYAMLDQRARAIATCLRASYSEGAAVLLIFEQGINFISAFLGAIYGGFVPVPSVPPRNNAKSAERLRLTITDASCVCILSESSIMSKYCLSDLCDLTEIDVCQIPSTLSERWSKPILSPAHTAFLQYTSGSTSEPKGVMVTHNNILDNEMLIQSSFGSSKHDVVVGWLPLFHDMGLIGNLLHPFCIGAACVLMSPTTFISRPDSWLIAISRYRGTISGGPDFSYRLVTENIQEEVLNGLDLSSWRVAYNGAEPVLAETLDQFASKFKSTGFDKNSFLPCYGLAESTLLVTAKKSNEVPVFGQFNKKMLQTGKAEVEPQSVDSIKLVSSGTIPDTVSMSIVDPESFRVLSEGTIGEIWVRGKSVANGYWKKEDITRETFGAAIDGGNNQTYLRTGDLGFMLGTSLFVTGRIKDLIIIRGQNYFPTEIEQVVQQLAPGLIISGGAAVSVLVNGVEQLVVVQEVARTYIRKINVQAVTQAAREKIADEIGVALHELVLVKPVSLPKTTSGKMRRLEVAKHYREGRLKRLTSPARKAVAANNNFENFTASEILLMQLLQDKFAVNGITNLSLISQMGLDSLALIQFTSMLNRNYGLNLHMSEFEDTNVQTLAAKMSSITSNQQNSEKVINTDIPSVSEEHFVHLHHYLKNPSSLNVWMAFSTEKNINIATLQKAINYIVLENPLLLSNYSNTEKLNRVRKRDIINIESLTVDSDSEVKKSMTEYVNKSFDLSSDALLRIGLFVVDGKMKKLAIVGHHSILDLLSLVQLTKQLLELYGKYNSGWNADTAVQSLEYARFCHVQRLASYGNNDNEPVQRDYWINKLRKMNTQYNNTFFNSRHTEPASSLYIRSGAAFLKNIKQLSSQYSCSDYSILMSLFCQVMHRYVGTDKLLVTSPFSGRSEYQWANVIGTMVNPVWIGSQISPSMAVGQHILNMKDEVLTCLENQNSHVYAALKAVASDSGININQLSQISFAYQANYQTEGLGEFICGEREQHLMLNQQLISNLPVPRLATQSNLEFFVSEAEQEFLFKVDWAKDGLDELSIKEIIKDLQECAAQVVEQGNSYQIAELHTMLSNNRRADRITTSVTSSNSVSSLLTMLQRGIALNPTKVALCSDDAELSYEELLKVARQVAVNLHNKHNITEGSIIAVMLKRDVYLVPILLGIWMAGGCYVALDEHHPESRILDILDVAEPDAVLANESIAASRSFGETTVITDGALFAIQDDEQAIELPHLSDRLPAYVIFTSGSTGKPKGVVVSRRSVANYCEQMKIEPGIAPQDRVLAMTTIAFDISVTELILPIIQGATIIMASGSQLSEPTELCQLIAAKKPTFIQTTPSRIRHLLDSGLHIAAKTEVILCGEPLTPNIANQILRYTDSLWNMYGPTEATVMSSRTRVFADQPITLGHALANTLLYILDEQRNEVPTGVIGELYIGGICVAEHYINQPELTAERFISNPFITDQQERMYRTGDLVSKGRDEQIYFHGRIDNQVKLRGNRIELEEIEYTLKSMALIDDSIVKLETSEEGEGELVAYCVINSNSEEHKDKAELINDLFAELSTRLPLYMLPTRFYRVGAFNVGPTGKIDRENIPMDLQEMIAGVCVQRELSMTEQSVTRIWCEVLGRSDIGVDDNFFAAGGNSINATTLQSRLAQKFGVNLPSKTIFELQTIALLSEFIDASQNECGATMMPADKEEEIFEVLI